MDEPTDGLDPNQKHEMREMIREMAHRKTIILSTHILEEVEAVCTRAIIIAKGKIVADDTPEGLKARSSVHGALYCAIRGTTSGLKESDLCAVDGVESIRMLDQRDDGMVFLAFHGKDTPPPIRQLLRFCGQKGYEVESLKVEEGRLDEVFRMITTAGHVGGEDG